MLTMEVPLDVLMYPCGEEDNVIIDCGNGYCAVKRPHEAWRMETKPNQDRQLEQMLASSTKTKQLENVKRLWEAEYTKFVKDGSVLTGPGYYPHYIEDPEFFEEDIFWVMLYKGELSAADEAWIKNSRELIEKYHVLYEEEERTRINKSRKPGKGDSNGFINQT
jgi:hypothetical protein